jgi:hypothetical protein
MTRLVPRKKQSRLTRPHCPSCRQLPDLRVSPDYPGGWRFGFGKILSAFHDGPTISAPSNSVDSLESSISRAEFDVLIIVSCKSPDPSCLSAPD